LHTLVDPANDLKDDVCFGIYHRKFHRCGDFLLELLLLLLHLLTLPCLLLLTEKPKQLQPSADTNQLADTYMLGMGNQYRTMRDCSALAVFLLDLESSARTRRIYELEKTSNTCSNSSRDRSHFVTVQAANACDSRTNPGLELQEPILARSYKYTALAVQSYVLAMSSHDLQTSIMEGFDARKAK